MDQNLKWVYEKRIERTMENLRKNNMEPYYITNIDKLYETLGNLIAENSTVSSGGSQTLYETGILEFFRKGDYNFLDRYTPGLTPDQTLEIQRKAFFADTYVTSVNAITEDGELFNVDGNGNRVAALTYGPTQVVVIVGHNKLVKNLDEAFERNRSVSGPTNAKRLNKKTPCVQTGYCMECESPDRICNTYVVTKRQNIPNRIKVIILNKSFGY